MSEKIVRFSRLLRIFELNKEISFIIELEEDAQKILYISYLDEYDCRQFESYKNTKLKKEFEDLSNHCLMDQCVDATYMFYNSPITHFEADCSSLVNGYAMFKDSKLYSLKGKFPSLKNSIFMFNGAKIKEIEINFPKLKNGGCMFLNSSLEKFTSQSPLLENGYLMFGNTPLKEMNCKFPKLIESNSMFKNTPHKFKENYPQYFI